MPNKPMDLVSAFVFVAVTSAGIHAPLGAQEPVRLAFGYQCDNRFVLQNEGTYGVEVAYGVVGTDEGGRLSIDAGQTLALETRTPGDVEILVDDRVVATAENTGLSCQPNVVVVRPLYQSGGVTVIQPYAYGRPSYYARPLVRFVVPRPSLFGAFIRGFSRSPAWNGGGWDRDRDDYRGGRAPSGYRPDGSRGGHNPGRASGGSGATRPRGGYDAGRPQGGARPDNGSGAGRPQDGGRAGRPQDGGRAGRPQDGGRAGRPQDGGRAGRPQDGNGSGRSQNDNGSGRSQKEQRTAHPRGR